MATDVYPEIRSVMTDLCDVYAESTYGNMMVNFKRYDERKGFEIRCQSTKINYGSPENMWAIDGDKSADICPIFKKQSRNSSDYMDICEASITLLDNLRKRKLRIANIIDKIDNIPTILHRSVLFEKIKK